MKKIKSKNRKVIVAMSGGIDSSVAAALLKKEGFDVVGVFVRLWLETKRGSSSENEKRARLVAKKLDIPFYVFNFEKEFKKKVVNYFLENYKIGVTPNPCVVCNKEIKFGLLFKKLLSLDTNLIATGHYARVQRTKNKKQRTEYKLLKGKDKEKDQSYFLWQLNQKLLKYVLFPVGNYTKYQVRKVAGRFKLPVLDIPESQEICFIKTSINNFLKKYLKLRPGKIINSKGEVIGEHQGLWFYTVGQRKGIKLPSGPFYVLDKDINKNLLIVTKNEKDLYKKELIAKKINWISKKEPKLPLKTKVKIRYKHKPASATVMKQKNGRIRVVFPKPQRAITPGQSAVFYKDEEVLGGGVIE